MAYLKQPEPGAWQRAADQMQALWLRTYRSAQDYVTSAIAVRIAADFGERGASDRPTENEYRTGVSVCLGSLTSAMMISDTRALPPLNPRRAR